jgi:hypothetical protein
MQLFLQPIEQFLFTADVCLSQIQQSPSVVSECSTLYLFLIDEFGQFDEEVLLETGL